MLFVYQIHDIIEPNAEHLAKLLSDNEFYNKLRNRVDFYIPSFDEFPYKNDQTEFELWCKGHMVHIESDRLIYSCYGGMFWRFNKNPIGYVHYNIKYSSISHYQFINIGVIPVFIIYDLKDIPVLVLIGYMRKDLAMLKKVLDEHNIGTRTLLKTESNRANIFKGLTRKQYIDTDIFSSVTRVRIDLKKKL